MIQKSIKLSILAVIVLTLGGQTDARAELLQIIHVNDLHARLLGTYERDPELKVRTGGYARVRTMIDQMKEKASEQKIDTLVLDAGDNLDGSQYYFVDRARAVVEMLNHLSFDVSVIGNHDYLMGPVELEMISKEIKREYHFIGANFLVHEGHPELKKSIRPYVVLERAGAKIGIIGLTTDSPLYKWTVEAGGKLEISDPIKAAKAALKEMRPKVDYVIALTHLGVKKDQELIEKTSGIDLVVGGHSHTFLNQPSWAINLDGNRIPIVQAGKHGHVVGDLLVRLDKKRPLQLVRYGLKPVDDQVEANPVVEDKVTQITDKLQVQYAGWVDQPIVRSAIPLRRPVHKPTIWGNLFTESLRQSAGTELALTVTALQGVDQPAGMINGESLMSLYPRVFELDNKMGYTVWKAEIGGGTLLLGLQRALKSGASFTMTGIEFDVEWSGKSPRIKNARIGGNRVLPFKKYSVAVSEGIARGLSAVTSLAWIVLSDRVDTGVPVWRAAADHLSSQMDEVLYRQWTHPGDSGLAGVPTVHFSWVSGVTVFSGE